MGVESLGDVESLGELVGAGVTVPLGEVGVIDPAGVASVLPPVVGVVVSVPSAGFVVVLAASATHSGSLGLVVQSMHPVTLGSAVQVTASLLLNRQATRTRTPDKMIDVALIFRLMVSSDGSTVLYTAVMIPGDL